MTRLPFTEREHAPEAVRVASEVVARGGVVLLPTETFYGLGADPRQRASVDRVLAMKQRPDRLAIPVLCADWTQLERLVEVPEPFRIRLSRIWPGPLTAVLTCRRRLPGLGGPTLGVRIPGHSMLRSVLYRTGPLTGTSANRHGAPPCREPDAALESLLSPPDLVLDGGPTSGGLPSTVVDLTGSEPVVLRAGAFDWHEPFPWQEGLPPR